MTNEKPGLMQTQAASMGAADAVGLAAIRRMESIVGRNERLPLVAVVRVLPVGGGPPRAVAVSIPGC